MQHPLLYLGLLGFDAASQAQVEGWLAANSAQVSVGDHPVWQVVDFREADALLVRGAGVAQGFGSYLQFLPALQAAQPAAPLGVDLAAMKLPVAISDVEHLHALGIQTKNSTVFSIDQDASMLRTIMHFETILRPLRTLFALAVEFKDRRHEMDSQHTYHLERSGNLDAIIDLPKRRVMLRPGTRPVDIGSGAWLARPKSANFAPPDFMECGLDEIGWVYATHRVDVELPKRYLSKPIHILRNPRVRNSLLHPRHVTLIDQLWNHPTSFAQLQKQRPEHSAWLERDLYALYLTRCISTQKASDQEASNSSLPASFNDSSPWMQGLSKRMNTLAGELQSLF
jgi:hypothetical protein